ncbi:hypothetical protein Tco_0060009 [Tanacetum coccineum]
MTEEKIKNQKGIKEVVKADVAKSEIKKGKQDLIDLMGFDVMENMYTYKVKYDTYCPKMQNRRAEGKITNYDVLSRGKGPITLKVYRDDGSEEIIQKSKPIRQRLDALHGTEAELELDLSKTLDEQDPIIKLNLLVEKKRKNVDDLHDYFKPTKRYKRLVHLGDHQAATILNEPSLGMILFNSSQRKYFISIEDFEELNNEMTFSTFLVAEVEKRNLNPNKQMRLIEQLRQ